MHITLVTISVAMLYLIASKIIWQNSVFGVFQIAVKIKRRIHAWQFLLHGRDMIDRAYKEVCRSGGYPDMS